MDLSDKIQFRFGQLRRQAVAYQVAVYQDPHADGFRQQPDGLFRRILPALGDSPHSDLHRLGDGLRRQDAVLGDRGIGLGFLCHSPVRRQLGFKGHGPGGQLQLFAAGQLLPLLRADHRSGLCRCLGGDLQSGVFLQTHQPEGSGPEHSQLTAIQLGQILGRRLTLDGLQSPLEGSLAPRQLGKGLRQHSQAGQVRDLLRQFFRQLGQVQQGQTVAADKAALPQLRETLGQLDGFQILAVEEGIVAHGQHSLFHLQSQDLLPVVVPGSQSAATVVRHSSLAGNGQLAFITDEPGQAAALAVSHPRQSREPLLLEGRFQGTLCVGKNLVAGLAGVVGVSALLCAGGSDSLGLGHGVSQGGDGLRRHGSGLQTGLVLKGLAAGGAGVVQPVALLRAGGGNGVHNGDAVPPGGQDLRLGGGLLLPLLIQEDLVAVAAGIVGIVSILGAGCGLGLRQSHGVAQDGEGFRFHRGLIPVLLILVDPAAGIAEVVGIVASGGTGWGNGRDKVSGADVGQTVVNVGGGEIPVGISYFNLLPGDFVTAVVDVFYVGAAVKSVIFNVYHACRDSDTCQCGAIVERVSFNAGDSFRNSYALQAAAVLEGGASNACHTVRNGYTL